MSTLSCRLCFDINTTWPKSNSTLKFSTLTTFPKLPCLPMVVTLHSKLLFGVYFEYCWTSNSFGGGWVISKNWLMPNIGTTRLGECHLGKFHDEKTLVGESSCDECLFSRILFFIESRFHRMPFLWKVFLVESFFCRKAVSLSQTYSKMYLCMLTGSFV